MVVQLQYIPTSEARDWWPSLGGFVNKAARRYRKYYDVDDMQRSIFDGDAALFGVFVNLEPVAAIVCSEEAYPKRRLLRIELVGGSKMADWFDDTMDQLAEYATKANFDAITSQARHGWKNYAKRGMFEEIAVAYERDLRPEA